MVSLNTLWFFGFFGFCRWFLVSRLWMGPFVAWRLRVVWMEVGSARPPGGREIDSSKLIVLLLLDAWISWFSSRLESFGFLDASVSRRINFLLFWKCPRWSAWLSWFCTGYQSKTDRLFELVSVPLLKRLNFLDVLNVSILKRSNGWNSWFTYGFMFKRRDFLNFFTH